MGDETYQFKTEPMDHQKRALRMLMEKGYGGLLMEPGLGKTKVVIDYVGMRAQRFRSCSVFVLAPLSAVDTWPDEVEKHLPDHIKREVHILGGSGADKVAWLRTYVPPLEGVSIVITNLDVLSQSHKMPGTKTVLIRDAMKRAIKAVGFQVGVIDESHRIKGPNSNVSRSAGALSDAFDHNIIMTGTVAPHSPRDLFGQWRFLNPRRFGTRVQDFDRQFVQYGGYQNREMVGFHNLERLRELRDMDSIVVIKRDALDLPDVTTVRHPITLTPKERKAYLDMANHAVITEKESGKVHISPTAMTSWLRLRQLTSGHITDGPDVTEFGRTKATVTLDLLKDLTSAGEKVVVFAHFIHDVMTVATLADSTLKGVPVEFIYGDVDTKERQRIRKKFLNHDGPMVVVAQMRTVSLAVNEFVAAAHAIYVSMSERGDDFIQSKDRLDRHGQTRPVTLHHMVVPDSIDEAVLDAHAEKRSLEAIILQDPERFRSLGEKHDA